LGYVIRGHWPLLRTSQAMGPLSQSRGARGAKCAATLVIGSMASTASSKTSSVADVWAVRTTASGTPPRSETTWRLEPAFPLSVGFGPVRWPPFLRGWKPSPKRPSPNRSRRPPRDGSERWMEILPYARLLPVAKAPPAGRARSAAHLLGQHLPGYAALQYEDDAGEGRAVVDAGPAAIGFGRLFGQQRFDDLPKFVRYQFFAHADERNIYSPAGFAMRSKCVEGVFSEVRGGGGVMASWLWSKGSKPAIAGPERGGGDHA
jgi:hypothetical protein